MIAALIILLSLVAVGAVLYIHDRISRRGLDPADNAPVEPEQQCCGMHITCEKDSLSTALSDQIEYYDDEELDTYRGRKGDEYTDAETEQFRDILLTLLPTDIAGWGRSLQLRGIELPTAVRQELLMIVAEARIANSQQ
jgi:hypothetical protein